MKPNSRYRRLSLRVTITITVANLCGALLVMSYLRNTSGETETRTSLGIDLGVLLLVSVGLMLLGNFLMERRQAPLWKWYRQAINGQVTAPAPQPIRRMALNMAGTSALASLATWLVAGLLFSLTNGLEAGGGINWARTAQTGIAIIAVAGPVTTIIIYFAMERIWCNELPLFFSEGMLVREPAFRMTVRRRLLVLFSMAFIPLLDLALISYSYATRIAQAPDPTSLLPGFLIQESVFVVVGLLLVVVLALTLGASLVEPLDRLGRRMRAVQEGDLDQQVPVTSNDELGQVSDHFNHMVHSLKQRSTELQTLYRISQDISASLELDTTLQTVLEQVRRIIPYDGAEICLYEEKEGLLRVRAWSGAASTSVDTTGRTYLLGQGYTGWIGQQQQALLIPDVDRYQGPQPSSRQLADGLELNSFLGVPLLVGGRLVGTLELVHAQKGALGEHECRLLETVAPQAAIAIQNAAEVLERERRLQQQIADLRIEIDRARQARQVSEIVESDYFQSLRQKARRLRRGPTSPAPEKEKEE